MVEGARIDMGHHKNWAVRALNETAAFDEAVAEALRMVDTDETLVVVTADHSHNMIFTGYTGRHLESYLFTHSLMMTFPLHACALHNGQVV